MRRALAIAMLALLAACPGEQPPLLATEVDMQRPMPGLHMSAGYLALTNNSAQPIVITGVTSPQFAAVEMHESTVENGISRMRPLDELTVPPGQTVRFEPGGRHLMLMNPVAEADHITLQFHAGDAVVLTVTTTFSGGPS